MTPFHKLLRDVLTLQADSYDTVRAFVAEDMKGFQNKTWLSSRNQANATI
jgi:hypothetical protein